MWKIFAGSFWVVMAIHAVVFTSIGLFTDRGWGLLILFAGILAITIIAKIALTAYAGRHPEKERLRRIMRIK